MSNKWISQIKVGDVLRSRSGLLRVVRNVNHLPVRGYKKPRTSVSFSIQRCSWTHRCYTVYFGNDLIQFGFRPVNARVQLRKKIDKLIKREIQSDCNWKPKIDCCDVRGIS